MTQPIRLGDLLVRANVISEPQLQAALAEQQRWGGRLGATLVRMGLLSEDLLVKALSKQLGIPRANLDGISVPPALLQRIDRALCERYSVVPLQFVPERRALLMAVSDPFNVVAMDDLSRRVGMRIEPFLAGEGQIAHAIQAIFGPSPSESHTGDQNMRFLEQTPAYALARPGPPAGLPPQAPQAGGALTAEELDQLAKKQAKMLRAVVELLIEKRVVTRDEYLAWVAQRQG